jgi:hypothetical protein
MIHEALESGWCATQLEWHDQELIMDFMVPKEVLEYKWMCSFYH